MQQSLRMIRLEIQGPLETLASFRRFLPSLVNGPLKPEQIGRRTMSVEMSAATGKSGREPAGVGVLSCLKQQVFPGGRSRRRLLANLKFVTERLKPIVAHSR